MCRNRIIFNGESMVCGSTITKVDSNGVRVQETVRCYSCVREAALIWNIRNSCRLSADFSDFDAPDEYGFLQAA